MPPISNARPGRRAAESSKPKSGLSTTQLAGIIVATVILLSAGVWLLVRWNRKRNVKKRQLRQANMGAAFLSARGQARQTPGMQHERLHIPQ